MKSISRNLYIDKIKSFIDTDLIKVITGVRRSGKSEILKLIQLEILKKADKNHIIYMNFEDLKYAGVLNALSLYEYIKDKVVDQERYYVFFDEIQLVNEWEKVVNSLRLLNTDIYITGSNAKLLSGELATLIAGRYVSFEIYPLSLDEFIHFRKESSIKTKNLDDALENYIQIGGFPVLSTQNFSLDNATRIVEDINSSIVLKDVIARHNIRNVDLLERLIAFIYDNLGNQTSIRKISDYLKNSKRNADLETIGNYLEYLQNAYIIHKAPRFDIKGKKLLESNDKYYLTDHSLQYAVRTRRADRISGILENIVYMEAKRRGYEVYVGKLDNKEIDFIATKDNSQEKVYIQVCYKYSNLEETKKREFEPLKEITDHHPKYVVNLDQYSDINDDGVKGIHLKDFLSMKW